MATQILRISDILSLDVTVGTGDDYSENVLMRLEHNHGYGKVHRTNEAFLTPIQLELLGRFLVRQADEIRTARAVKSET